MWQTFSRLFRWKKIPWQCWKMKRIPQHALNRSLEPGWAGWQVWPCARIWMYVYNSYIHIYIIIYIIYIIYIQYIQIRRFQKMGVPPNIPKSSIWNGLSIVNHPAIGATPWKAPYPWGRSRSPQDCPQLPQQPGLLQVRGLPSPWRRLSAAITWFLSMEYAAIWSICH